VEWDSLNALRLDCWHQSRKGRMEGTVVSYEDAGPAQVADERQLRAFERELLRVHGPLPPPASCPIGWQPTALTPVFYGIRDYDPSPVADPGLGPLPVPERPPARLRVFFPSLDGAVFDAAILEGCGRYPLILFAHGHCQGDANQFLKWFQLPAQLARSGYVVVVPQLTGIGGGSHPSSDQVTQQTLAETLQWMRESWEHRATLLPAPATGLAGHSFGALHAGILATTTPVAAVASLSGVWIDWPGGAGPRPILLGTFPRLFTWGTEPFSERDAILPDSLWNQIAVPKHRAVFTNGEHFDYLYAPQLPCRGSKGPCRYVGEATADLVTMFFARYLPPELTPDLPGRIPGTLVPPPLQLTPEQEFFAGGHLIGMGLFNGNAQCGVAITRELSTDRTVPYVIGTPQALAAREVRDRDLVPRFTFTAGAGQGVAWVASQSPHAGVTVAAGSEVRMLLQVGPIP
jgi:Chlorophyllase enzyme